MWQLPWSPVDLLVTTLLAWVATLWTLPRYLRGRSDVRCSSYWQTLALLTVALTCWNPPIYAAIDHLLRLPNAARWISNAGGLGSAYMVDTFFYALAQGPRRLRWYRPWLFIYLVGSLSALAVLLWWARLSTDAAAQGLPTAPPVLMVYQFVFLAFLGVIILRCLLRAAHYQRQAPHALVRLSMALLCLTGAFGLGYIASTVVWLLAPADSPLGQVVRHGLDVSMLASAACLILGGTAPGWGKRAGVPLLAQHFQAIRRFRRLRRLWRALTRVHPEVVLPTAVTWYVALLQPHAMDLLLNRLVIEIFDARRLLLDYFGVPWPPTGVLTPAAWPSEEEMDQLARAEAGWLATRLRHAALTSVNQPEHQRFVPLYQPPTYEESLRYLERVAVAFQCARCRPSAPLA